MPEVTYNITPKMLVTLGKLQQDLDLETSGDVITRAVSLLHHMVREEQMGNTIVIKPKGLFSRITERLTVIPPKGTPK